jgi:hypothetical protein
LIAITLSGLSRLALSLALTRRLVSLTTLGLVHIPTFLVAFAALGLVHIPVFTLGRFLLLAALPLLPLLHLAWLILRPLPLRGWGLPILAGPGLARGCGTTGLARGTTGWARGCGTAGLASARHILRGCQGNARQQRSSAE